MLLTTRTAAFLFAVLAAGTTYALPFAGDSVSGLSPRAISDPCVIIARAASIQPAVAADCFKDIKDHIFIGGKSGTLNSDSGKHLASTFLPSFSGTLGRIDATTLIMSPDRTDGTKTLWMDHGLLALLTTAQAAQASLATAQTALEQAKNNVATQKAFIAKQKTASKQAATQLKRFQNVEKTKEAAVKAAAIKPKDQIILNLQQSIDFVARETQLYTQAMIQTMCVDAMMQSFKAKESGGKLLDGKYTVAAENLGPGGSIEVRLLAGNEDDGQRRPRINSCFPVLPPV